MAEPAQSDAMLALLALHEEDLPETDDRPMPDSDQQARWIQPHLRRPAAPLREPRRRRRVRGHLHVPPATRRAGAPQGPSGGASSIPEWRPTCWCRSASGSGTACPTWSRTKASRPTSCWRWHPTPRGGAITGRSGRPTRRSACGSTSCTTPAPRPWNGWPDSGCVAGVYEEVAGSPIHPDGPPGLHSEVLGLWAHLNERRGLRWYDPVYGRGPAHVDRVGAQGRRGGRSSPTGGTPGQRGG